MAELPPMQNYRYGVLGQKLEDDIHADRLLLVEERPIQRVTRLLLSKESLLRQLPKELPTETDEEQPQSDVEEEAFRRQKFREDVLLDFAALESSLLRIQLINASNQRERERYAVEKAKILDTAQAVRDNTVELHAQLKEAQAILQRRKGYDELACKILDDKKLKSRQDCQAEIANLEKEIDDLQQESAEYEGTWQGRREQFDRVVAEGEAMVRLIKGIKDDPEVEQDQDENMEDGDESTKVRSSRMGTPMPGGRTPMLTGGETPMPMSGEAGSGTPARPANRLLDIDDVTRSNSRAASPARQLDESQTDVEMADTGGEVPPKASTGMEASANQVAELAEGVTDNMDET